MKKNISILLVITLIVALVGVVPVSAKNKKTLLSAKTVIVNQGKKKIIQLKNPSKKVKWTVANKKIVKIQKKSGKKKNKITIKGLKAGKTKITATCAGKRYTVKITVKKKKETSTMKNLVDTNKPVPEVATPEKSTQVTTPESTTIEIAAPEQTTEEMTESETNEETTTEATSESETSEETTTKQVIDENYENKNIVASVEKESISMDEELVIIFTLQDYQEGQLLGYGVAPKKVEQYVNGEWVEITKPGFEELWWEVTGGVATYKIQLNRYFDLEPGHYRWTHEVNWVDVSVEFDII